MFTARTFRLLALLVALSLVGLSPLAADTHDGEIGGEAETESETENDADGDGVVRISGPNRYQTAAALSQVTHADGADHVFVATGGQFVDALTGAVAAALVDAPMLFAAPGRLQPAVADALALLDPAHVTIVGGPAAVAPPVVRQIEGLLDDVEIDRVGGGNRYATAVAVSQWISNLDDEANETEAELTMLDEHGDGGGGTVFLATGGRFPDALVGATLAVAENARVLLTADGTLPAVTAEEIERLGPARIIALGGQHAVSDAVLDAAADLVGATTERIAGGDRYETAVAVSQHLTGDGGAELVYVATGVGWADAVAGAAAAGSGGVPVLLVRPGALPDVVADELARLAPGSVRVLGGPSAVTGRVADALEAVLGAGAETADDNSDDNDDDTEIDDD
jgi:putative cell wall-binding protein